MRCEYFVTACGWWSWAIRVDRQAKHQQLTGQIIALETRLNAIVYDAFGLDDGERQLIEDTTKYPYGEV